MPIYEYNCKKCGDFEVMQKMSDKALSACPTCGRKVTKLISSTSFQLKGSGWYITDYARKGDGGGKSDDKKAADKKSSESGTEGASAKSDTTTSSADTAGSAKSAEKTTKKAGKKATAA